VICAFRKFKKEGNVSGRTRTLSDWESVTVVDSNLLVSDVGSADFHLVTKKQRKRKTGRSSSIGRERNNNSNNVSPVKLLKVEFRALCVPLCFSRRGGMLG